MNTKPILFSTEMVQAIVSGRKTQTRRKVKSAIIDVEPSGWHHIGFGSNPNNESDKRLHAYFNTDGDCWGYCLCPYGAVGDVLWVKENFTVLDYAEETRTVHVMYEDGICNICELTAREWEKFVRWKQKEGKKSKLFMFASLSRIFLKSTKIRVERLQDISEADSVAEGVETWPDGNYKSYTKDAGKFSSAIGSYKTLWEKINGPISWDSNPWVWVVEFERCDKPEIF